MKQKRNRSRRGSGGGRDWNVLSLSGNLLWGAPPIQSPIIGTGTAVQVLIQQITPVASVAPGVVPPLGEMDITRLDLTVDWVNPGAAGIYQLFGGLYVAQVTPAGAVTVRDPALSSAVVIDDWLSLKREVANWPLPAAFTLPVRQRMRFGLPRTIRLREGYALVLALNQIGPALSTIGTIINARYKWERVD